MLNRTLTRIGQPDTEQHFYLTTTLASEFHVTPATVKRWGFTLGLTRWYFAHKKGVWYSQEDVETMREFVEKPWLFEQPERLEPVAP